MVGCNGDPSTEHNGSKRDRPFIGENPIITEHGGRTDAERAALGRDRRGALRAGFRFWNSAYHNFPRSHPLYGAGPVEAVLGDADAILLAGCNGPWHPPHPTLRPGCAVIHLEQDPMRPRAAYWGYPTTHTIPGDLPVNLGVLADNVTKRSTPRPEAAQRWARYTRGVRAAAIEQAGQLSSQATDFVSAADLFRELHDALPDDAICVDEITAQVPQMIQFLYERKPSRSIADGLGALGTGLGPHSVSNLRGRSRWSSASWVTERGTTTRYRQPLDSHRSTASRC